MREGEPTGPAVLRQSERALGRRTRGAAAARRKRAPAAAERGCPRAGAVLRAWSRRALAAALAAAAETGASGSRQVLLAVGRSCHRIVSTLARPTKVASFVSRSKKIGPSSYDRSVPRRQELGSPWPDDRGVRAGRRRARWPVFRACWAQRVGHRRCGYRGAARAWLQAAGLRQDRDLNQRAVTPNEQRLRIAAECDDRQPGRTHARSSRSTRRSPQSVAAVSWRRTMSCCQRRQQLPPHRSAAWRQRHPSWCDQSGLLCS